MNAKNIAKALRHKLDDWCKNIESDEVKSIIKNDAIITGGALVSLLTSEPPNDYDIYFKTKSAAEEVANYYAGIWNKGAHGAEVEIREEEGRITAYIKSRGVAEDEDNGIDDETEPFTDDAEKTTEEKEARYRPRFFSTNAISLTDKIQLIIRFYGSVEEIHTNYDFVHCTCSYDYKANKVNLPSRALEAIINKELFYSGSKYPLCSIIRTRKFISRGWTINAGQYLKMCLQLNELDLTDLNVFKDQLAGVDSAYFNAAIVLIMKKKEEEPDYKIDNTYLFEVINKIF